LVLNRAAALVSSVNDTVNCMGLVNPREKSYKPDLNMGISELNY